MLTDAKGF